MRHIGTVDIGLVLDLLVEALPEFVQHRNPVAAAFGDFIQLVFQIGGEVVIHVAAEMLGEEFVHHTADIGRCEALFIQQHVFAILQGGDDAGIG